MKITIDIPADKVNATLAAFRIELFDMEDVAAANPEDLELQHRLEVFDALYWELSRAANLARIG